LLAATASAVGACDKVPLMAPTNSTITVSAPTQVLASGGSAEITAFVLEEGGTPVQNGTAVRFSSTLGRVEPVEARTTNGLAITTFFADNSSGVAEIRATSGAAAGGTDNTNVVQLTVGAAAVNTVTLRANPGSVGPGGGAVELIATVIGADGQLLPGVAVTFSTDQGSLSAPSVTTNVNGESRTTLTTTQQAVVSATAGITTSSSATVTVRSGPSVTITCAPASGTGNCAAVQADTTSNTATVIFTITKPTGSSTLRTATIDFGDGNSQSLGNLAGGTATSTRVYSGPSGSTATSYTATVQVVDIDGEAASASTVVIVTPKAVPPQLLATLTAALGTAVVGVGQPVTLTAAVTPATDGADVVSSYAWTFGDNTTAQTDGNATTHVYTSNGAKTATVEVTTTDGRTATAVVQFIVSGV
jgi:adhesin/invasin